MSVVNSSHIMNHHQVELHRSWSRRDHPKNGASAAHARSKVSHSFRGKEIEQNMTWIDLMKQMTITSFNLNKKRTSWQTSGHTWSFSSPRHGLGHVVVCQLRQTTWKFRALGDDSASWDVLSIRSRGKGTSMAKGYLSGGFPKIGLPPNHPSKEDFPV